MPKWTQYVEDDDLDNELPQEKFQKIKKKTEYGDELVRPAKKKPKIQYPDPPLF